METDRSPSLGENLRLGQAQLWVLLSSLVLNGALAVWLVGSELNEPAPAKTTSPDQTVSVRRAEIALARVNRTGPRPENDGPAPPFHWSELESSSYPDYIAKLRAAGCPESVIRDVITADLAQVYAARARQIWTPTPREYWQKPRQSDADRPNPSQMKQLTCRKPSRKRTSSAWLRSLWNSRRITSMRG